MNILKNNEFYSLQYTIELGVTKSIIQKIINETPFPIPKNREEARMPPALNREHKEVRDMTIKQLGTREHVSDLSFLFIKFLILFSYYLILLYGIVTQPCIPY